MDPVPRGAQSVMMVAKVCALLDGRINLSFDDIKQALVPALRHRMILNFQAEADGVDADTVVQRFVTHADRSNGGSREQPYPSHLPPTFFGGLSSLKSESRALAP